MWVFIPHYIHITSKDSHLRVATIPI
jgi:hypothetical protein